MQNEQERLRIHTGVRPAEQTAVEKEEKHEENAPERAAEKQQAHWKRRSAGRIRTRRKTEKEPMTIGERLLRNTALSCALLLSVLAIKNVDQPWSRRATEGIRQAMTMSVNWDETLGRLSFVRALVPDTALVFFNMGTDAELIRPVSGEVSHGYTEQQPWLEYTCSASQPVCAAMDGRVTAVGQGASGDWIVLLENDTGGQAVFGYLADACVQVSQQVEAGEQIGMTAPADGRVYFEFRQDGQPADPSLRMR